MGYNAKLYFKNNILLTVILLICIVFVYAFAKINANINLAVTNIEKETERSVKLQLLLDSIQVIYNRKYDTKKVTVQVTESNLEKVSAGKSIKKASPTAGDTQYVKGNSVKKDPNSVSYIPAPVKKSETPNLTYQRNLSDKMISINSYESIMLATAVLKLSTLNDSYFSLQKVTETEVGKTTSKMVYFDCVKAFVGKDSSIDLKFVEEREPVSQPLDPINYDRSLVAILNGRVNSPMINCVIFWRNIGGQPFSARFKLNLANQ